MTLKMYCIVMLLYDQHRNAAAIGQLIERRVSDRKVADPWFDSQTGNALLCSWERR